MSDNVNTELITDKPKFKTFSVSIPEEQFEMLNKYRFTIFMDKAEFYRHIFQAFEDSIPVEERP